MIGAPRAFSGFECFLQPWTFTYSSLDITSRSRQESIKHFLEHPGWDFLYSNDLLPLRDLTLQESKLSQRMLSYKSLGRALQCQHSYYYEYNSRSMPVGSNTQWIPAMLPQIVREDPRYRYWYTMIRAEYSGRRLSFESNRLPALSGLASAVVVQNNGIYCAGIRWKDMAWGFCWRRLSGIFFWTADILSSHLRFTSLYL
jgi:hypothetical protein